MLPELLLIVQEPSVMLQTPLPFKNRCQACQVQTVNHFTTEQIFYSPIILKDNAK